MHTPRRHLVRPQAGYALLLALVFVAVSLLLLTSMLQRISGSTAITDRNNAYNRAVAAAEAATEMALSHVTADFVNQTFNPVSLDGYRNLAPTGEWAAEYEFSNGAGAADRTWVECSPVAVLTNLDSQFSGVYGSNYLCRARANVRSRQVADPELNVAVRQDFQLASIPIFQFGIYYALDLEIHPYSARRVTGKVHGNANIYTAPESALVFAEAVGAVGRIFHQRHPDDPAASAGNLPEYQGFRQEKVSSLTLPVGGSNSPVVVRQILERPPGGELPTSVLGRQRYFNKSDLVVITTATNLTVHYNRYGDGTVFEAVPATNILSGGDTAFLKTNVSFYDYREGKPVLATEINVEKFILWLVADAYAQSRGRVLNSIYVDDQRNAPDKLTAVRVVNGRVLPSNGLTVATARPLYVKGHFNALTTTPGATNTFGTRRASLVGDSLTVLSDDWSDAWGSGTSLDSREAENTTINAAILAGIVPTTSVGGVKRYSGGVDNALRLLEDWSGETLTFNGSLVVLFPSRFATNHWISPGSYYRAPDRKWAFDPKFLNWNNLPPGTPRVQKLVRGRWNVIAADTPN